MPDLPGEIRRRERLLQELGSRLQYAVAHDDVARIPRHEQDFCGWWSAPSSLSADSWLVPTAEGGMVRDLRTCQEPGDHSYSSHEVGVKASSANRRSCIDKAPAGGGRSGR